MVMPWERDWSTTSPQPSAESATMTDSQKPWERDWSEAKVMRDDNAEVRGEGKGFFDRVGADIGKRAQIGKDIEKSVTSGETSKLGGAVDYLGKVGYGIMGDVIGEGIVSAGGALGKLTTQSVRDTLSSAGRGILGAVQPLTEKYGELAKEYPRTARRVEALTNIAGGTPIGGVAAKAAAEAGELTGKGLATVGKGIKNTDVAAGLAARGSEELDNISTAMRAESSATFKRAFDAGVIIKPDQAAKRLSDFDTSVGRISRRHTAIAGAIDEMKINMKAGGMGLEDLYDYRQEFADIVSDNTEITGKVKSEGFVANKALSAVDDMIEKLTDADVSGGVAAIKDLDLAKAQWSKARKHESVARIITLADGDPNKIKAGFKRFTSNKKNLRGFTDEEKKLLDIASRNSLSEKILKGLGRFGIAPENVYLPLVGAGLGSMAGAGAPAAALIGAGTAARQIGKWKARGKGEKVLQAIENRKP